MATFNSASYEGRYLQLYISETTNAIANTSTLNWTLSCIGGSVNYYTTGPTTVTINGTQVYYKARTGWDTKQFPAAKGSTSGSITVAHNSDGSKSISIGFSTAIYTSAVTEHGGTMTLTKIDRSAPTINVSTSRITASSVTISASASTTCDVWEYSTNGGGSYTQFLTTASTSVSRTITGLSPNTTYSIRVRARKKSNQVYGTSSTASVKTLGNAILNSVSTVTADNTTASITFNRTIYSSSFTYTLEIKNGSTSIMTISISSQSAGTGNQTVSLTATQRTTLLNAFKTSKSFTGTFILTTKSGSTTIGNTSSKTATIQTTAANSAPTFSNSAGFVYADSNTTTSNVTGNALLMVQDYSRLTVTAYSAAAKNGASITQYEATINGKTVKSTGTTLSLGTIAKSGNLSLTVTAVDSRGYTVSVTKTITVIAYQKISISEATMRRVNEAEAITQVDFTANISRILVSSVNKNAFVSLQYRYKKTSESSYGTYTSLTSQAVANDTRVTYENDEFVSLDADYSYNIQFYVSDKITSDTIVITLSQGTPLISKRRKMVGINNRNPTAALDVTGEIKMNGYYVQGFVKALPADTNLNNALVAGIYSTTMPSALNLNYPVTNAVGVLEVIQVAENFVMQRFTAVSGEIYCRSKYNTTWHAWKSN